MELINYIEDTHILYDNPYYHSFEYNKDDFINMITEGIKSPILLGKPGGGNNGKFYVSLSKHENCEYSIYDKLNSNPMFVIDRNLKTLKTRNFIKKGYYPISFMQSPLPFRESEYDDEYQKFLKVSPKYILAIQYNIFSNCEQHNDNSYIKQHLLILTQIIKDLESLEINLPIIDSSTSTKINKEKVLSLKIEKGEQ